MARKPHSSKARKRKALEKEPLIDYDEAIKMISAALLDGKKRKSAEKHPVAGPIIKQLGEEQFARLSTIARNQEVCVCPGK
jgi:hypothetical protein